MGPKHRAYHAINSGEPGPGVRDRGEAKKHSTHKENRQRRQKTEAGVDRTEACECQGWQHMGCWWWGVSL